VFIAFQDAALGFLRHNFRLRVEENFYLILLPVSETLGTDQVVRGRCQVDFTFLIFVLTFFFLLIELNKNLHFFVTEFSQSRAGDNTLAVGDSLTVYLVNFTIRVSENTHF
jgi:hypothetical protein